MKKLLLKDVRRTLPFQIQRGMSLHYLSRFADGKYNTALDFDVFLPSKGKNLQRGLVWTEEQKSELILSVLKGIKLPPLAVIIDDSSGHDRNTPRVYRIIDGKQRFSTLLSFYKNEFPVTVNGEKYFYNDLDKDAQMEIALLSIHADVAYEYSAEGDPISDNDKIAWFEMINFAGTPQDLEHLKNLKS